MKFVMDIDTLGDGQPSIETIDEMVGRILADVELHEGDLWWFPGVGLVSVIPSDWLHCDYCNQLATHNINIECGHARSVCTDCYTKRVLP